MSEDKKVDERMYMDEDIEKWISLSLLCGFFKNDIRETIDDFLKEPNTKATAYLYATKLLGLELKYRQLGLSWEDIREVRGSIINGKN